MNFAELSNGNIFLTFNSNQSQNPNFSGYHPYPPTFVWLDSLGNLKKQITQKIPDYNNAEVTRAKKGMGDYFYVMGTFGKADKNVDYGYYAFITKYNNQGDTIWDHKYRHPSEDNNTASYYFDDIVEMDNGDIVGLGTFGQPGSMQKIWLFKVNSNGCFGGNSCDELQTTDVDDVTYNSNIMRVSPNPVLADLKLQFKHPTKGNINITDMSGKVIYTCTLQNETHAWEIDVSNFLSGMYFISFLDDNHVQSVNKFVKVE
jgi:Secretion system C-terminal sorting domain